MGNSGSVLNPPIPEGFELEHPAPAAQLPPGFELENHAPAPPPGFELEKPSLTDEFLSSDFAAKNPNTAAAIATAGNYFKNFPQGLEGLKERIPQAIVKSDFAHKNPEAAAAAATLVRVPEDIGEFGVITAALPEIAPEFLANAAARLGGPRILAAIEKYGGKRVASFLGDWAKNVPASTASGGVYGALEPANDMKERAQNTAMMAAMGPAFDLVFKGVPAGIRGAGDYFGKKVAPKEAPAKTPPPETVSEKPIPEVPAPKQPPLIPPGFELEKPAQPETAATEQPSPAEAQGAGRIQPGTASPQMPPTAEQSAIEPPPEPITGINEKSPAPEKATPNTIQPVGEGDFGPIYTQFIGKPKEAIDHLMSVQHGEAIGALYHPEIGNIDLPWGVEGTGKHDGYGLSKIAKFHGDILDLLGDVIPQMDIVSKSKNRINLRSDTLRAGVRLDWNGNQKRWLLTAFDEGKEKGPKAEGETSSGLPASSIPPPTGKEVGPDLNISPTSSEVKPSVEGSDVKPFPGKPFVPQEEATGARPGEGTERQNLNLPGDKIAELERRNLKKLTPEFIQSLSDDFKTLFLPTSKSPEHLRAAEDVGAELGKKFRAEESMAEQLKEAHGLFTKMGVYDEKMDPFNPDKNPGLDYELRADRGIPQPTPERQKAANTINAMFDERVKKIRELGTGALETVKANYFPRIYKDMSNEGEFAGKRPLEGGKSFLKKRVFDTRQDALEAGYASISNNPVDIAMMKLLEMDRYIFGKNVINKWKENGQVKFVKVGKEIPEGYASINDNFADVRYRNDKKELVLAGRYVAQKPNAEILNNYLSQGTYDKAYFRAYMTASNVYNQFNLGLGSMFHPVFTSTDVQVSKGAFIIDDIYQALRGRGISPLLRDLKEYPTAWKRTPTLGNEVRKEWLNPGSGSREVQQIAKAMELAGGRVSMEKGLRTNSIEELKRNIYGGNKIKSAAHVVPAITEAMATPIMQWLVPNQKLGLFGEMVGRLMEANPGKSLEQLTPELRQAWNRVDARLGQVVYTRYFMNNLAKNATHFLFRAPGWAAGSIGEIGGAPKDLGIFMRQILAGKVPDKIPDRVAYTISLAATTFAVNGALTYAFTGTMPQGMDFLAFRDGGKDSQGKPTRCILPTYMKDVYAYSQNAGHTLIAKANPVLNTIADIVRNKDYYGVQVYNPDDKLADKIMSGLKFAGKQAKPFWISGEQKIAEKYGGVAQALREHPARLIGPYFGIMPASAEYTNTKAEKLLNEYTANKMPVGARTQAEFDKSANRRKILESMRNGTPLTEDLQKAYGAMSAQQKTHLQNEVRQPGIVTKFNRLPIEEAANVWKVATPEERDILRDSMRKKIAKHKNELQESVQENGNDLTAMPSMVLPKNYRPINLGQLMRGK